MKKKTKILHILYSGLGGTTDYVFNFIKGDVHNTFEHLILFYGIEKVPKKQLEFANQLVEKVFFIDKSKGYDKRSKNKVSDLLKSVSPDILILNVNSLIITSSKYKNGKLIFVEHQANHLKTKKEWLWSIIAQKKADYVITLTDTYQKELKRKLKLFYQPVKNVVIKTGLVLKDYATKKNNTSEIIKIGMVSRINKFRDHKTLIEAFRHINIPNIELHIAGDGPLLSELQKLKYLNVFFHGNIPQKEIPQFLNELTIYCHASKGETSSIALMQAQASGLPIIATNVKGINNVLIEKNCIFVEPKSVDDYKKALELLINSKSKRSKLSKKSFEFAQDNLSHISMFEDYTKLLKE